VNELDPGGVFPSSSSGDFQCLPGDDPWIKVVGLVMTLTVSK